MTQEYKDAILQKAGGRKVYIGNKGGIYILIKGKKKYLHIVPENN